MIGFGSLAVAPVLRHGRIARADATPGATPAPLGGGGTLAEIWTLAPDILAGATPPLVQIASYANLALQVATLGMPPGGATESDWFNATSWLAFPAGIAEFAREPRWRATFGFEARQIDLALEVGSRRIRLNSCAAVSTPPNCAPPGPAARSRRSRSREPTPSRGPRTARLIPGPTSPASRSGR